MDTPTTREPVTSASKDLSDVDTAAGGSVSGGADQESNKDQESTAQLDIGTFVAAVYDGIWPGDKVDGTECEEMLKAASEPFSHCDVHAAEMIEKNIACLSCNKLICALCMRDSHLSHDIISVNKLCDCMTLWEKIADDLNELQVLQMRLQTQMEERKMTQKEIESSNKKMCAEIDGAFQQLQSVLHDKKKEIKKYLTTYHEENLDSLRSDLKTLEEKYTNSTRMIQKVIACTTKPQHSATEVLDLLQQLKSMVEQSQLQSNLDNVDLFMAENKFSKVLPSLEAVFHLCKTLHPEATKVVWIKQTPEKKNNCTLSISLKRKSSSAFKTMKRMKSSSSPKPTESAVHPKSLPEPTPGEVAATHPDTPFSKSPSLTKPPNSPAAPATASAKTPASATTPAGTLSPRTAPHAVLDWVGQNMPRLPEKHVDSVEVKNVPSPGRPRKTSLMNHAVELQGSVGVL